MTPEEKREFVSMQKDIHDIKREVGELARNLGDIKTALMGSTLSKDGGLVNRIATLEEDLENALEEIESMKRTNQKMEQYQKIIWSLVGAGASGVFGYVLNLIFKH